MKPILYESTRTQFNDNGIGILSDAVSCFVTEERNGRFELVLNYPVDGIHYAEIKQRSIIAAKAHADGNIQPFRVYRITKPLNGMVSIYAEHISYDLSGVAVSPFTAGSAAAALQGIKTNSVIESPFEFWTDKSTVAQMSIKTPASARAVLGGVQGSVLDTYGGEYEWDGYTVKLHNERGQNRGVSIRYGKNLVDLEQEENCAAVYTAVMPFWADSEGNSTMLTEKIVRVSGTFDFERVHTLDLSNEFDAQPTQEELRSRAQSYIKNNNIGVPKISLTVSFVPLEQTEEYKDKAFLEKVLLCDTVNVVFEKLGVSATAKVVKTVFDVLLDRYKTVELGDAQSNLADTLVKQDQAIKEAPKKAMSMVAQAAENATQLITGNRGGYVVIHSSTGQSQPDEILIMDKPTIEEAVKVWRWNNSGLGYSETGYSGTYTTAWTIDGAFNADFITAGTLSANLIKSGLLQSFDGTTSLNLETGVLTLNLNDNRKVQFTKAGIIFGDSIVSNDGILYYSANQTHVTMDIGNFGEVQGQNYVFFRNVNGVPTLYPFFDGKNLLILNENAFSPVKLFLNNNGDGELDLSTENGKIIAQLKNKAGAGGQLELRNEQGQATFSFSNASGGGAECWIGEGNGVYKLFDYNNGINVHVDHLNVYGKSSGLVTGKLKVSECSAYIVFGQPTSGGYISSMVIPSSIAAGYDWQIADEMNYIVFSIDSSGNAIKNTSKSSSNSGTIVGVYCIR
jgi:phage minor structural protein